jgi:hypothetical protein
MLSIRSPTSFLAWVPPQVPMLSMGSRFRGNDVLVLRVRVASI